VERIADDLGKSTAELSRLKKIAGVITSLAFAYILGGVVLALRLDVAGFPVRDALQVIPPQNLLFIGVRELVLSGLVAAILVALTLALVSIPRMPRWILTLGRYMVPPNEFPVATVSFKPVAASPLHPPVVGGFLASTSDYVYVAHRDRGNTSADEATIDAFARDSVLSVRLRPRPDEVDPRGSLFGALTGVDVAATPWLDLWVDDDQKGLQLFH
jgi:hypothetical protein